MNAKTTIRKILFVTLWLCIGGGMLTLLLAAITKKNHGQCSDYSITLKGTQPVFFIDKKDMQQLLVKAAGGTIKGRSIASFDLHQLEQSLEHNTWISDAELYFDNQDVLHVTVTEKEPVARIFTTEGNSFYIDSAGRKMPLSDKLSVRVPVFTGFPEKKVLIAKDSLLLTDVRTTAQFIINDPFWMAQVAQVDITPERNFEMIPVVGNHTVKLGNGEDIAQKFHRLFVFYRQVLSKTGFDKYKMIDVQYKEQVVVSKQAGNVKVDSVQLRKNVEKLLRQSREAQNNTIIMTKPIPEKSIIKIDSATVRKDSLGAPTTGLQVMVVSGDEKPYNPNPVKTTSVSKPPPDQVIWAGGENKTGKPKPAAKKKEPKAIMPTKPVEKKNGVYD